jgi:hypothetical protein
MSHDSLLAVPVAAVGDGWMAVEFLPKAAGVLEACRSRGGLLWLPVDAGAEADYLLSRLAGWCQQRGWSVEEVAVSPVDPLRFWAMFTGSCEAAGLFGSPRASVVVVRGGELLPLSSVATHRVGLEHVSRATTTLVIMPLFRSQESGLEELAPGFPRLQVPSFAEADAPRRRALAEALVASRVPGLAHDQRDEFIDRLLQAGPASRPQLESWLEVYGAAEAPLQELRQSPPPFSSDPPHVPPALPTRRGMKDRFTAARERLHEAAARLRTLWGMPLLFNHQPLAEPFASPEPGDWLVALVSHLSCLVFDAGKNTLEVLFNYNYDSSSGDIIGQPCSDLMTGLRRLRTVFQHAISLDNDRNQILLQGVADWYQRHCGERDPGPEYARMLVAALLTAWEEAVDGLVQIVTNLATAPSMVVVRRHLEAESRNIEQGELLRLIEAAVARIDPGVDGERVRRKYEEEIRRKLRSCCLAGRGFEEFARQVVEEAVAEESRRCPTDGDWLQSEGLEPGPELGYWRKFFREEWEKQPLGVSAREFEAAARERLLQRAKTQR